MLASQKVTARNGALDLNHAVEMALLLSAARLECRARLICALGDPLAVAGSSRVIQALVQVLAAVADALPPRDPQRSSVRVSTVETPDGSCCVDILVTGRGARDLPLPSAHGHIIDIAESRCRADLESAARRAGARLDCDKQQGVGAWIRLALPAA
jgi:hypothetical protein